MPSRTTDSDGTRPGTGKRRSPLSRATVVATGRRLARDEGLAAVTLRAVAAELGVTAMALYRHVGEKRELLVAMLDDVAEELVIEDGPGSPSDRLVLAFRSLHDHLTAEPWVAEVLRGGDLFGPAAARFVEHVLALLAEAGLDEEQAADAYWALWWYTFGHLSYLPALGPEGRPARHELMTRVRMDDHPRLARMLSRPPREGAAQDAFVPGLKALLRGLPAD
ncbi:TetR/AcrR family transcriptional regulator [Streptomyces sp. V2]|jgi:AcrR family transcriptional regulator|uniref:TetR/AcrR family transcriptional regulator n=1 Tax=Streptomyces niveiscabiei TaxID=164115 RepID=A0ABW9HS38_9ACTN|nr:MULTISPECIES: TetR/AcrR family transcriptional regulator [Streptomyces]MDX3387660.1 TetR/AcrR family transcriptional regulator [Streptomyces niveiscabiei]PWG14944.1 TetR/AcrR family transcriptional regulator [Streptomyces sp. V2]QZZ31833.1 TetR/AcrR family transcriptional regulator [Streptomyces sp. ST1015]